LPVSTATLVKYRLKLNKQLINFKAINEELNRLIINGQLSEELLDNHSVLLDDVLNLKKLIDTAEGQFNGPFSPHYQNLIKESDSLYRLNLKLCEELAALFKGRAAEVKALLNNSKTQGNKAYKKNLKHNTPFILDIEG